MFVSFDTAVVEQPHLIRQVPSPELANPREALMRVGGIPLKSYCLKSRIR